MPATELLRLALGPIQTVRPLIHERLTTACWRALLKSEASWARGGVKMSLRAKFAMQRMNEKLPSRLEQFDEFEVLSCAEIIIKMTFFF